MVISNPWGFHQAQHDCHEKKCRAPVLYYNLTMPRYNHSIDRIAEKVQKIHPIEKIV
ncbi:hypothetical protein THIOM_000337 [Candidatus Thiomargarita nelsonii]|uniref:Uncharacterized protein n=1 Tax=Candidatus Thiomargarita nelsonii TaxID=1003181 RepID=A0A176S735_9GAMM|nr:hypothetical protein THIOM_000337 [Candidatus Thiomargarita nelsonii]